MSNYKNIFDYFNYGKVYINCSSDFFIGFDSPANFDDLLIEFALTVQSENYALIKPDKMDKDGLYKRRIRRIILNEANAFINEFDTVSSEENAYSHISQKQFKELEKVFDNKKGRISCYSLIILRSIFFIMKNHGYDFNDPNSLDIKMYITFIKNVVNEYYNEYPDDIIAHFLIECYTPVISLLDNESAQITFPAIPKRYTCNKDEE